MSEQHGTRTMPSTSSMAPDTDGPAAPTQSPSREKRELIGTLLDKRYLIDGWLGEGAMGVVYSALDLELDRLVAIKVVSSKLDVESGQDRLAGEARAMARLRHPNVVTVHDIGRV